MEKTSHGLTNWEVPHLERSLCGKSLPEKGGLQKTANWRKSGALSREIHTFTVSKTNTSYWITIRESVHMEPLAKKYTG